MVFQSMDTIWGAGFLMQRMLSGKVVENDSVSDDGKNDGIV